MHYLSFGFVIFTLLLSCESVALCTKSDNVAWQKWRKNHTFSVSYRKSEHQGVYSLKSTILLNSTIAEFYQFLHDKDQFTQWVDRAKEVSITKHSNNESSLVTTFSGQLFIKDRVLRTRSFVSMSNEQQMLIHVIQDRSKFNVPKNTIEMTLFNGCWLIQKLSDRSILVTYQFTASPNGKIPIWLINKMSRKSLWNSLENLDQIFNSHYTKE